MTKTYLSNNYANIPKEMRALHQWGCYHRIWEPQRNKYTKIPVNPYTGGPGKSNDPSTWSDFKTALAAIDKIPRADGLAFYFANGYVGLDIDHIDGDLADYKAGYREDDNVLVKVQELTQQTYLEVSMSGTGLHAIFKGKIPGKRRRKGNFEMYQSGRFFALTGATIGQPKVQTLDQDEATKLYQYCFGQDKPQSQAPTQTATGIDLSVSEIISKAESSLRNGPMFSLFMQGGWEKYYSSHSEADMAFANYLAFWCAKDYSKMDAIFRSSSLMRDKWDSKRANSTYGKDTLEKAIADATDVYQPKPKFHYNLDFLNADQNKPAPKSLYSFPQNDSGNAERFEQVYQDKFLWNSRDKAWYVYNGGYWAQDDSGAVMRAAAQLPGMMRKTPAIVDESLDEKAQKKVEASWRKFVKQSGNASNLTNMVKLARKDLHVQHGEFDTDPMILNTPSGYVDLRNGSIHDHTAKMMLAHQTAAEYSDSEPAPRWEKFIREIFLNDKVMIHYFQKCMGYCLIGGNPEQVIFILNGNGRNGKSVSVNTVQDVIGNYAGVLNVENLMVRSNSQGANPEIARLEGTRMVVTSEVNEGARLDEGFVKQITGGERISARFLYGKDFDFKPDFKLVMTTNHLPIIRGTDNGIWRRLIVIPFEAQIPENKVDLHLQEKLEKESVGILNWLVEGALNYQLEGLTPPQKVIDAGKAYRTEMDQIEDFIEEVCEEDPSYADQAANLYQHYSEWAKKTGHYVFNSTKFGAEMTKRFDKKRSRAGNIYVGIKVREDFPGLDKILNG